MKNKPWKVRVHYNTGDSFHSGNSFEVIDIFASEKEATEAAALIRDHYDYYCKWENIPYKAKKILAKEISSRPWFVFSNAYPNNRKERLNYFPYTIALCTEGKWFNQSVAWTGYFESLVDVEVYQNDNQLDWEYWEERYD